MATMMYQIRALSMKSLATFRTKTDYMDLPKSNNNNNKQEADLCKFIYKTSRANSRIRKEMNAHSYTNIWCFVKNLPMYKKVYILDQSI